MTDTLSGVTSPEDFPLFQRFPKLRSIPRAPLCTLPSPVEKLDGISAGANLWIKRDDLNAPLCGGNKVRSLEFLLGGIEPGDTVVTVGGAGSTHILSTAIHAARLGAKTVGIRWKHDMNPVAHRVSSKIEQLIPGARVRRSTVISLGMARYLSATGRARHIPLGGATRLGMLGHVNAALELASQIERDEMPAPERVVVPFGSGGTIAGLLLGFAISGLSVEIVGARVGPRMFVNRRRAFSLAKAAAALIERTTGERIPQIDVSRLRMVQNVYGGAYGRQLPRAREAADILQSSTGIELDDTYSAKAWLAALDECRTARGPVLYWLTFDAKCLTN